MTSHRAARRARLGRCDDLNLGPRYHRGNRLVVQPTNDDDLAGAQAFRAADIEDDGGAGRTCTGPSHQDGVARHQTLGVGGVEPVSRCSGHRLVSSRLARGQPRWSNCPPRRPMTPGPKVRDIPSGRTVGGTDPRSERVAGQPCKVGSGVAAIALNRPPAPTNEPAKGAPPKAKTPPSVPSSQ